MRTAAFPVEDSSHVAAARRGAVWAAERAGFDETRAGQVAIVATELATNILKHAGRGEMLVSDCGAGAARGLEILALDAGPGLPHLDRSIRDGHSTTGSLGLGLGAVSRLSDAFDVFSLPGKGSVVLARLRARPGEAHAGAFAIAGISVALAGEEACGDDWVADVGRHRTSVLVADGLGHGLLAADAAAAAVREFSRDPHRSPAAMLEDLHNALRATRGAALGVAHIDLEKDLVTFAGLGNIGGAIVANGSRKNLTTHNGIAGYSARHVQEFGYPLPREAVIVLNSDGLGSHWSPADYPGLWVKDPALIAGAIYRDFTRRRDDATVVVGTRRRSTDAR
ncbi:MAG TPA: ATP-binding SpoIIE family protein phosphatase [Vicinamibacterales bacterium]|jgi:anti-sigma regulatory factor (Ser/Thr protein kinase)